MSPGSCSCGNVPFPSTIWNNRPGSADRPLGLPVRLDTMLLVDVVIGRTEADLQKLLRFWVPQGLSKLAICRNLLRKTKEV